MFKMSKDDYEWPEIILKWSKWPRMKINLKNMITNILKWQKQLEETVKKIVFWDRWPKYILDPLFSDQQSGGGRFG